jgi:hypothetical protein
MTVVYPKTLMWYLNEPRIHALLIYISKNLANVELELSQET